MPFTLLAILLAFAGPMPLAELPTATEDEAIVEATHRGLKSGEHQQQQEWRQQDDRQRCTAAIRVAIRVDHSSAVMALTALEPASRPLS